MPYCSTAPPDWRAFRQKYNRQWFSQAAVTDDLLYVMTRYVVLYQTTKIDVARVRACHYGLNLAFEGKNTDDNAKIPNTTRYPWTPLVGIPNILFLPINADDLQVSFIQISQSSISNVDEAASLGGIVDGVLNIYIAPVAGSLLGQAGDLGSNILVVEADAVGFRDHPGTLANYDQGKVLIHEVGHCLGLSHIFADTACDNVPAFPDTPEQVTPNFYTELFETSPGVWDCKNDNRYLDRIEYKGRSCLLETNDPTPNEMGVNFMDYGKDDVSILFTQSQATIIRAWLQGNDNDKLTVYSSPDVTPTIAVVDSTTSSTSDPLLWVYIMVPIAIILGIVVIGFFVYRSRIPSRQTVG